MNKSQRQAIFIADRVLSLLQVRAGQTERAVAARIRLLLRSFKARPAFRIIIASGMRAVQPHGRATNKRLRRGDLVVIDFGALYNGYRSDITRTIVIGRPSRKQRTIFNIVKQAQKKAVQLVRANRPCAEVDQAAREYIKRRGYAKQFVHSTGHGIGKKVHQAPRLSPTSQDKLKAGMIVTIEPGIYIEGWGGVRLEDMVEVTARGCRVLTRTPKRINQL